MTLSMAAPHLLSMHHRTSMVISNDTLKRLENARVLVVGLGGVGSWCAEALVRSGVMNMTIVDSDIICSTNINRQIQATSKNIGRSKASELGARLLEINPGAEIDIQHKSFDSTTCGDFQISNCDYVIDAIDSIANKVLLIETCVLAGVKVYSSMGAAAKTDPGKIRIDFLSNTSVCPLARIMRRNLKNRGITTKIPCVYSLETPVEPRENSICGTGSCACTDDRCRAAIEGLTSTDWCEGKKRINGSLVHITAIFGMMLASMLIRDIAEI